MASRRSDRMLVVSDSTGGNCDDGGVSCNALRRRIAEGTAQNTPCSRGWNQAAHGGIGRGLSEEGYAVTASDGGTKHTGGTEGFADGRASGNAAHPR